MFDACVNIYNGVINRLGMEHAVDIFDRFEGEDYTSFVISDESDWSDSPTLKIEEITVAWNDRGKGLGRKIINNIEVVAKENGFDCLTFEAFPYTDGEGATGEEIKQLVKWYEKQGFIIENKIEYNGIVDDEIYFYEDIQIQMYKFLN